MSSNEPNDSGGQMDSAQEGRSGLVVASSNGTVLLQTSEEVLDQGGVQASCGAPLVTDL